MPAHPKAVFARKTSNRLATTAKKPCIARTAAMIALMPCTIFCGAVVAAPAEARSTQQSETVGKFYCNISALPPAERAHHTLLTAKLLGARKQIVETPKGYEFQLSPSDGSL